MTFRLLGVAAALLLTSACSNYQYKTYAGNVDDPTVQILDLSGGATNAPVIYFDTVQYRALGVPYHRLLLAVRVDGEPLPNAGKHSILNYSGYQAIRLAPGQHSLEWCWVSMNKLGTGGGQCGFNAPNLSLEAGKRYIATWSSTTDIKGVSGREHMEINVTSFVLDRDTKKQIFP
ncbi:hypothetical protein [Metapseudomonas otitidis]|jgi:hypothetical protein|uniref:Lipoprotein n=1 Tax=Metapseudomonas otitidis TaxID=319939 RepID=A0A679G7U1_9GAMM|nr:hypothetical protein [Pseudomonas otitidis]WIF68298.1 hypothetical protein QN096_03930 [Pseudomonas otitidis]BCA26811.1 hypothetical protein PtoMrB4_07880 [Pseudomonas otitidis]